MRSRRAIVSVPRIGATAAVLTLLLMGAPPAAATERQNVALGDAAPANVEGLAATAARNIVPVRADVPISAAIAVSAVSPGTFTGKGFDACSAPSSATMNAWLASPYRAVGIYFGGVNRGCTQPNLTSAWVSEQLANGWHLIPIYMGLQAPCTTSNKKFLIDPAQAAAQGRANAEDAVAQAQALGLARGSVLIDDMEAYRTGDAACRTAVLNFVSAWTSRLHDLGYLSGFYGSLGSGVADQVAVYNSSTLATPDYLDFARYDGVVTTSNSAIPSAYWSPHRRIKQYQGGHNETWGGVTINIDNDYLDVAPLPADPFGDFGGNGWSDLIARTTSTGTLHLYPGNGTNLEPRISLGSGWNAFNAITRFGDFNRDGHEDVIARQTSNGDLWLYRGTGTTLGSRIRIGTGWNIMREITPIGDLNHDGYPDLVAVQTSNGNLYFYPGVGTGFGARKVIGPGWNSYDALTGIGDMNRDGYVDLLARQKSTGNLYLYPGRAGAGFGARSLIGSNWNTMRDLTGIGDFNRDGNVDLLAVNTSSNNLYFYPGQGTKFGSRVRLSSGWSGRTPLL